MRPLLFFIVTLVVLGFPSLLSAHPVISEVMWMGTDLSTADEWIEITNPDSEDIELSGWTITSVNSSAKEIVSLRFATGSLIHPGEYLVIASRSAANSRLLAEPFAVSAALSLPNTKLLLRLRDVQNSVIDEVDDGIGAPFAGDNPSGTGAKASMERIDALSAGNLKENWRTASVSSGFDIGSNLLGTPGSNPTQPSSPSSPPCSDPLEIAIAVQSGPLFAIGKATINFQAVATVGSLTGVNCTWSYGDGFTSTSCNPPVHSFTVAGTYTVRLEAKNQCGITLIQEQIVQVQPDPASPVNSSIQPTWYDGSKLILTGALPNPVGTDTGKEWVEIKNLEDRAVELRGWKLAVGETSIQSYLLKHFIGPRGTIRVYDSELKFKLPNTASRLQLITPSGIALSTVPWKSTEEGRVYFPDDIRSITVRGRVLRVTGPVTFILGVEPDAASVLGDDTVNVRILGVDSNSDAVIKNNEGQFETLRALIENKNIELQFDTETWDDMGRLLAHVYYDNGVLAQHQMMISKLWIADNNLQYAKKQEFKEFQKSVQDSPSQSSVSPGVLDESALRLTISEVYPAPFPASSVTSGEDWKSKEWLEIENSAQRAVDLSGWKLKTARSEKTLPGGLKVASGSRLVIRVASIGLGLRNAGDTVSLVSPLGAVIASLVYPALKNGTAYAFGDSDFCTTIQPTPGEVNACVSPASKAKKPKAVTRKISPAKKVSPQVRSYSAAYRAQTPAGSEMKDVLVLGERQRQSPWISVLVAFGAGIAGSGVGIVILVRAGLLSLRKMGG